VTRCALDEAREQVAGRAVKLAVRVQGVNEGVVGAVVLVH
jgi:hypothetical protein